MRPRLRAIPLVAMAVAVWTGAVGSASAAPARTAGDRIGVDGQVTVAGSGGRAVTLAFGELDPSFGNHPAFVAVERDGRALRHPELVVPGDRTAARSVAGVSRITVEVANPAAAIPPASGAVQVTTPRGDRVLGSRVLSALPSRHISVGFLAGNGAQQHTEVGLDLRLVQPRLVVGGDVHGGRYVSDVVRLVVGEGPTPAA
jgi:hypothetical protein